MNVHQKQSAEERYAKLALPDLQANLDRALAAVAAAEGVVADIQAAIERRVADAAKAARQLADKEFGVVHVALDGCDVEHTVPKTVKWDTDKLLVMAAEIANRGGEPYKLIDCKLSIPERAYETLPADLKALALDARTIKTGKTKVVVTVPGV